MTAGRHHWTPEFCDHIAELARQQRDYRAEGVSLVLTEPLKARRLITQADRLARQIRRIATWAEQPDPSKEPRPMHAVIDTATSSEYVLMTRDEASALFDALDRARVRLVADMGKTDRMRADPFMKDAVLRTMRGDLGAIGRFVEALGKAHGLGGY